MDPSISSGVQNVMTTPTTATFQLTTTQAQQLNVNVVTQGHAPNSQHTTTTTFSLSADSYEEVFKGKLQCPLDSPLPILLGHRLKIFGSV